MNEFRKSIFLKLIVVVIFGISLAYFEAAVVVYLREIFHSEGFTFPLIDFDVSSLQKRLLLTEIGREAASIFLITTAAWLFADNTRRRLADFLIIFAFWDIFYYVWLKLLLDWPASIMDWDILFLIPVPWASPVLAPVLVSILFLVFAGIILYRDYKGVPVRASLIEWTGFMAAAFIVIVSFCVGGFHMDEADYASSFSWFLFGLGYLAAILVFIKCLRRSGQKQRSA
jgi:hypothetical protein